MVQAYPLRFSSISLVVLLFLLSENSATSLTVEISSFKSADDVIQKRCHAPQHHAMFSMPRGYASSSSMPPFSSSRPFSQLIISMRGAMIDVDEFTDEKWISLISGDNQHVENSPVRKRILEEGTGPIPSKGSTVELEYTGTLHGERNWSVKDVVECWLSQLQG